MQDWIKAAICVIFSYYLRGLSHFVMNESVFVYIFLLLAFDSCSVFYKGVCGWLNSDLGASPWRQVMRQETERVSRIVNSRLKQEGWNPSAGSSDSSYRSFNCTYNTLFFHNLCIRVERNDSLKWSLGVKRIYSNKS